MLALKAFFDETGHVEEPTDEFLGLAGFVAPASKWLDLEPRWRAILENAGVSWFHAVDFAHFRGEFTGWQSDGDARRIALAKTLLSTITEAGGMPTPIAAILSTADYKSLPVEVQSCMRYEPYLHCFQQVARGAALEAKYEAPDERTSAVFAESDYSGMARELWAALRNLPSDEQHWYGDINFDSPKNQPGLQLADWFAYEVHQEFKRLKGTKKQWKPREPFNAFWGMCQPSPMVRYFSRRDLIQIYKPAVRELQLRRQKEK